MFWTLDKRGVVPFPLCRPQCTIQPITLHRMVKAWIMVPLCLTRKGE